ncbi:MAG: pseudouridine synthase [Phycisphaerales bacterium]
MPRARTSSSAKSPARPAAEPGPGRVRLQKLLADAGIASRRACEEMILAGEIEVDGETVTRLPCLVDPRTASISVRGMTLAPPATSRTVMVFKPRGVVCTSSDPHRRRRAIDIVPLRPGERLYAVGRLDVDSSGLLLLTNDGELANRLTHPRYGVHKGYEVMVEGRIDETSVEKLKRGVFLPHRRRDGGSKASAADLKVLRRDRDRSVLYVQLSEGRNRQIRRMLERLGHEVKRLRRVSMGPLTLSGLRPGQWRELLPNELEALERAAYGTRASSKSAKEPKKASYPKARRGKSVRASSEPSSTSGTRVAKPESKARSGSSPNPKRPSREALPPRRDRVVKTRSAATTAGGKSRTRSAAAGRGRGNAAKRRGGA